MVGVKEGRGLVEGPVVVVVAGPANAEPGGKGGSRGRFSRTRLGRLIEEGLGGWRLDEGMQADEME